LHTGMTETLTDNRRQIPLTHNKPDYLF